MLGGETSSEPDVALAPLHPPDATHEDALLALQERSDAPPRAIEDGAAESMMTVGPVEVRQEVCASVKARMSAGIRWLCVP